MFSNVVTNAVSFLNCQQHVQKGRMACYHFSLRSLLTQTCLEGQLSATSGTRRLTPFGYRNTLLKLPELYFKARLLTQCLYVYL